MPPGERTRTIGLKLEVEEMSEFEIFDEMDEIFDETFGSFEEGDLDRVKIEIAGNNIEEEKIEEIRKKVEDLIEEGEYDIEMSFSKSEEAEEDDSV